MSATLRGHLSAACAAVLAVLLTVGVLVLSADGAARADTRPLDPASPATPATVSADGLPTVQINGVVWSQVVVGNTVYAAGRFTSARPAGVPAGTQETPRNNLLAYDIRTGALITSFAPSLNAQALVVTASPDGSRIYVGGDFTQANGQTRNRIAAYDTATGALVSSFRPSFSNQVRAIAATNSTVYAGGSFGSVGGVARQRLAAVSAANGSLLPWAPVPGVGPTDGNRNGNTNTSNEVMALLVTGGGSQVVAAGRFDSLNGTKSTGIGALDATTGATRRFDVGQLVTNQGVNSAIFSLTTDGSTVFATGYDFYGPGNVEGVLAAAADGGELRWMADCHGDTYSSYPLGGAVYTATHAHVCSNIGGFPEQEPRVNKFATALSQAATGTVGPNTFGGSPNFRGKPAPNPLAWWPTMTPGSFTGQFQAGWSVTGNSQYVVYGGEFPRVNGVAQQGLVRYALPSIAPNRLGPVNAGLTPTLQSPSAGVVRVSWSTTDDPDNENLTYRVYRNGGATPVCTVTEPGQWWNKHTIGCFDRNLTPGSSHSYRVQAVDPFNNAVQGSSASVTVSSGAPASAYAQRVVADGANGYWRLGETSGTTSFDSAGFRDIAHGTRLTPTSPGAIAQDPDGAAKGDGTTASRGTAARSSSATSGPDVFSLELWFSTTSTTGGRLAGFGNAADGQNSNYDRHVYLDNGGRLHFGVFQDGTRLVSTSQSLNDGRWHHVVAQLSPAGQALYVDGKRVGTAPSVTRGQAYAGWWQVGGGTLNGWPSQPGSVELDGSIDEVALYPTALSQETVQAHYTAGGGTVTVVPRPADAYGRAVYDSGPDFYWRLDETGGTRAANAARDGYDGTISGSPGFGVTGAPLAGNAGNKAIELPGGTDTTVVGTAAASNPQVFSVETWFQTTSTAGGRLIGFGNAESGRSSNYDRHVYVFADGRLRFGVWTGQTTVIDSPLSYNDGQWHHVVATMGPAGMAMYVDGVLVGTNPNTAAQGYDGHWRLGADNTWGGASTDAFGGRLDEAAVYSTQLTAEQALAHYVAATGTTPANQPPTASFTATATGLSVSVDGSASADADGTIASHAWNWGDDTADGSGATATHAYAAAGTYTVTLTVTDDRGAPATTTRSVTVTAPPANQPPTASFTSTATGLSVSVDGSGSADPDGMIASHSWNWGDGTADGSGATATHAYAAAGTYTVRLTVTDDKGATATTTRSVTVTAPTGPVAFASDAFNRTVAGGLGTADVGGPWTATFGASRQSVAPGVATMNLSAAGSQDASHLGQVSQASADVRTAVSLSAAPTGGGVTVTVVGRRVTTNQEYRARLRFLANGTVGLAITRLSGTSSEALVGSEVLVPGLTYTPGQVLRVRLQVSGTGTTTLAASVWVDGATEPATPTITRTDTTASLQASGSVGLSAYLSSSATAPVAVRFSSFSATPIGG
jgi:PKD repeat protein